MIQPNRKKISIAQNESIGLSEQERAQFFDAIEPGLFVCNREQFIQWTQNELQSIFPHGMLACGIGILAGADIDIKHVICCNFPQQYVDSLQQPNGLTNSPILQKWMECQQPILFEPSNAEALGCVEPEWLEKFQRFGLVNVAAHGQCDLDNESASYFSFSCIPGSLSKRHALLLQLLVPHLHNTLVRITPNLFTQNFQTTRNQIGVTERECEILKWLGHGKTNWEISQMLFISESTVKKHVQNILGCLSVKTRTQAVAKAINLKLISTEK